MALWPKLFGGEQKFVASPDYAKIKEIVDPNRFSDFDLMFLSWVYESLEFATKNHFDFCEVIVENPLNSRAIMIDQFVKICKMFPIKKTVHAPFLQNNIISYDYYVQNASVEEYLAIMDLVTLIGAQAVVLHPGGPRMQFPFADSYFHGAFLANMAKLSKHYTEHFQNKFYLTVEVMPIGERWFCDLEKIKTYFSMPQLAPFHLTLDTSHAWTQGGDAVLQRYVTELGPKIKHIHVVDNQTFDNDPHIAVGKGKIDFTGLFTKLHERNVTDCTVTIEIPGRTDALASRDIIQKLIKK